MPRNLTISRTCEKCGSPFLANAREVSKGRGRFCSRECWGSAKPRPLADRFWEKVNKDGPIPKSCPELGPCWVWTGSRNGGYGHISVSGKSKNACRVSWELHNGPIPEGLWILHHCDNPPCVNPAHFFLGTHADNMADMVAKQRMPRKGGYPSHREPKAAMPHSGENNKLHKITERDVIDIRRRYVPGRVTMVMLAAEFGISDSTVSEILHWEKWAHVRDECMDDA